MNGLERVHTVFGTYISLSVSVFLLVLPYVLWRVGICDGQCNGMEVEITTAFGCTCMHAG